MAPLPLFLFFFFFFFSSLLHSSHQSTLISSPITKDISTNLYTLLIYLKTPLQPSKLHLDLGSYLPFYDCARHYKSSSYNPVYSNSSLCTDLNPGVYSNCFEPAGPGCFNDSCGFFPENPVTHKIALGQILTDKSAFPRTGKPGPGPVSDLLFSCTFPNSKVYRGLAKGSTGLAALGRFNYSLPAQLSRSFSSPQIFAVCLPGSSKSSGVALFNSPGPYYFSPRRIDISKSLTYTQLITGPKGADTRIYYWYKSPDYYLPLTSIKVNGRVVPLNQTLLAIDEVGRGGARISTSTPYTTLQSSMYKSFVDAFVKESAVLNLTVTSAPVDPFRVCYSADGIASSTGLGPGVPTVDLVLEGEEVVWRIHGWNSMVRVQGSNGGDAWCLGFVDGGVSPRSAIVIGGHQLEDNLLQFDLERGRLGFSTSLRSYGTTCANFDFSSN